MIKNHKNQLEQQRVNHHQNFSSEQNQFYLKSKTNPKEFNYCDHGVAISENQILTTQDSELIQTNSFSIQQQNAKQIQYMQTIPQEKAIIKGYNQAIKYIQANYIERYANYVNIPKQNLINIKNNYILQNGVSQQQPAVISQHHINPQSVIHHHNVFQNKNLIHSQIIGNESMESAIVRRSSQVRYSLSPPVRQEIMYSRGEISRSLNPVRVISRNMIQQMAKSNENLNLRKEINIYKAKCVHLENLLHTPNVENTFVNIEIQNKLSIYKKELQELRKKNLELELSCETIDYERERNESFNISANMEKNFLVNKISKLRELLLLRFEY